MAFIIGFNRVPDEVKALETCKIQNIPYPHISDETINSNLTTRNTTTTESSTNQQETTIEETKDTLILKVIPTGIYDGFMAFLYSATLEIFGFNCDTTIELGMLNYNFPKELFFDRSSQSPDKIESNLYDKIKNEILRFARNFLGKTGSDAVTDDRLPDFFIFYNMTDFKKDGYKKGWELGEQFSVYLKGKVYTKINMCDSTNWFSSNRMGNRVNTISLYIRS